MNFIRLNCKTDPICESIRIQRILLQTRVPLSRIGLQWLISQLFIGGKCSCKCKKEKILYAVQRTGAFLRVRARQEERIFLPCSPFSCCLVGQIIYFKFTSFIIDKKNERGMNSRLQYFLAANDYYVVSLVSSSSSLINRYISF